MTDLADIAGETLEVCLADAERRARGKSAPESHPDFDGHHCVEPDCGVEIPRERLLLNRIRCVYCQERREKLFALRAHNIKANA